MSEPLTEDVISPLLGTAVVGRRIVAFDRVGSTQDVALDLGASSSENPDGTLVVAQFQTHGRGRFGRTWVAPAGSGLLFSLVLCPRARIARAGLVTLAMAVSVAEAISQRTGLSTHLKWPNDVTIRGLKVCGVLPERGVRRGKDPFWVVGVGVNVNVSRSELPPEVQASATSLKAESGADVPRAELLVRILAEFEAWYATLQSGDHERLLSAVRRRTTTLGQAVRTRTGDGLIEGTAVDLDDDGALIVETALGVRHHLTVAEGTLV